MLKRFRIWREVHLKFKLREMTNKYLTGYKHLNQNSMSNHEVLF
jgi:hypothetical protein